MAIREHGDSRRTFRLQAIRTTGTDQRARNGPRHPMTETNPAITDLKLGVERSVCFRRSNKANTTREGNCSSSGSCRYSRRRLAAGRSSRSAQRRNGRRTTTTSPQWSGLGLEGPPSRLRFAMWPGSVNRCTYRPRGCPGGAGAAVADGRTALAAGLLNPVRIIPREAVPSHVPLHT